MCWNASGISSSLSSSSSNLSGSSVSAATDSNANDILIGRSAAAGPLSPPSISNSSPSPTTSSSTLYPDPYPSAMSSSSVAMYPFGETGLKLGHHHTWIPQVRVKPEVWQLQQQQQLPIPDRARCLRDIASRRLTPNITPPHIMPRPQLTFYYGETCTRSMPQRQRRLMRGIIILIIIPCSPVAGAASMRQQLQQRQRLQLPIPSLPLPDMTPCRA